MHPAFVFLFAIAAGLTLSGIIANIYRLLPQAPTTTAGKVIEAVVMIFGGPIIIAVEATEAFRRKRSSKAAYALAIGICGFWSLATGVFILSVYVILRSNA